MTKIVSGVTYITDGELGSGVRDWQLAMRREICQRRAITLIWPKTGQNLSIFYIQAYTGYRYKYNVAKHEFD